MTVRFDDAWRRANEVVRDRLGVLGPRVVLVRDLYGRIRVGLDDRQPATGLPLREEAQAIATELHAALGRYSPGRDGIFLLASQLHEPGEVFAAPDALQADASGYLILERGVVGSDWLRAPFTSAGTAAQPRRLTLYGVKGGVGRSTCAVVLARSFSKAGHRTLVIDLDLESPGLGRTLLPIDATPDYGVVDWFVEEAAGQADEDLVREMVAPSPIGAEGAEVLVVPAKGRSRPGYEYLPKLSRAYVEVPRDGGLASFAERLNAMVVALEAAHRADVTILDSRAGIHDIAAVAVTRLGAVSLLFAVESAQTWDAYRALFEAWGRHEERARGFRADLKMVATLVPETQTTEYLERFTAASWQLFADHLYVETPPGEESEFNFDISDAEAPHAPLRIRWSRPFQEFDPVLRPDAVTKDQVVAAYGDVIHGVPPLLGLDEIAK